VTRQSIAIYGCVKNEGKHIRNFLESAKPADEIVIVDTGSTDDTVEICESFGVTVHHATIIPWRFDTGRNVALALIPRSIDWCQRLDGDETMSDGWRDQFDDQYSPPAMCYTYPQVTHDASFHKVMRKDLHRRNGFFWRYPTHEVLEGPGPMMRIKDYWVDHNPDNTKVRDNIDVLRDEHLRDPHDCRSAFYYARELYYLRMFEPARTNLLQYTKMEHAWNVERGEAFRLLATFDTNPEQWLWKAIAEEPRRREPWVDMARLLQAKGRIDEALLATVQADRCDDETIYTTNTNAWGPLWDKFKDDLRKEIEDANREK
jgi:glycosyltransferase involved in cell wall biosynthesis